MSQISSIQYGGDMLLFVASGATVMPLAFSTSSKIDVTLKTRDVGSKDSGYWDETQAGRFNWTVSSDNLYAYAETGTTQTYAKLYALMMTRTPVNMGFGVKAVGSVSPNWTIATTDKFTGQILITALSITAGDNANATFTMSGVGTGVLAFA
jgi:predicted secreted protein